MDEFYQEINSLFYLKWIVMQNNYTDLKIAFSSDDENTINIEAQNIKAQIKYHGKGLFEQIIINCSNDEVVFYLHFQLLHLNHAITLFNDMMHCIMEIIEQPFVKVLLCCSGGLSTSLFANKMNCLAKRKKMSCQIDAAGYLKLETLKDDYKVIMLAPQIGYLLPQIKKLLPDKQIIVIPTKIFAMNDYVGALMLIKEKFY